MQIIRYIGLVLILICCAFHSFAQCPQPSFTVPDTICINEPLAITNTSTGASRYEWDFCSGDLEDKPALIEIQTIVGANTPTNITTVFDGTNWFGFFFSRDNNLLYRLEFGNSLNNSPNVVNVGNLGAIINTPEPIKFIKEGTNWYALGSNFLGSSNLFRLHFGNSLVNTPTITDLTNLNGKLNRPRGLEIVSDEGNNIVLLTNAGDNTLVSINFGNSILNPILSGNILKTTTFPGTGNHLTSTSIISDCDKWYGVTVSVTSNSIFLLDFGTTLFSVPTITNITSNLPLISAPFIVSLVEENGYYGFIQTDGGDLIRLKFGTSMSNIHPIHTNMGGSDMQNGIGGFSLHKQTSTSEWIGFTLSYNNNKLYKFRFSNSCSADISFSDKTQPDVIKYAAGGTNKITLKTYSATGEIELLTKSVFIRPQATADFTTSGAPPLFVAHTVSGEKINSWNWNFGDGQTGTGKQIQHNYANNGLFDVTLTVQDVCGQTASITKKISVVDNAILECPQASFTLPDTICLNDEIPITNTSLGGTRYEWEFCSNGLSKQPQWDANHLTLSGAVTPIDIETVFSDGQWHSFICSRDNNKLLRLDYGSSLANIPTIKDLGNIGNLLKAPNGIKFRKEGSTWYALLVNVLGNSSNNLVRLNFGNSLSNTPTIANITNVSAVLVNPRAIELKEDKGQVIAVIPNYGSNTVTLVNFGNSVSNNPLPNQILQLTDFVTNSGLWDVVIEKDCNQWYGFVIGYNSTFYRLDFGTNLFSSASVTNLNTIVKDVSSLAEMAIQQEQGNYSGFIITQLGKFYRINFGKNLTNNSPDLIELSTSGQFNDADGFELVKSGSSIQAFVVDWGENKLKKAVFPALCSANITTSTEANPSPLKYAQQGWQKITLTAYDANGNKSIITDSIFVRPDLSTADFTFNKACENEAVEFFTPVIAAGNYIKSWAWDFGDGATSTTKNPVHQFTSAGVKNISLTIIDVCGKIITLSKAITIYKNSIPDFIAPAEICSNQMVSFQDASIITDDNIQNWEWNFGNGDKLSGKNPSYTYQKSGNFTITLTITGKSGCSYSISKNITVKTGAKVDFSVQNACLGNQTTFEDLSEFAEGTSFVSRLWEFGDGETSDLPNPTHEYQTTGVYTIKLTVKNNVGCSVTVSKQIQVTRLPEPAFSYSLSCSDEITSFFDESTAPDGEIVVWAWNFGDPNSGENNFSDKQNPSHIFAASGTYQVTLTVKTIYGCSASITQDIQVISSPQSNFIYQLNCNTKEVSFSDQTSVDGGQTVTNWYWDFGDGKTSLEKNPVHNYQELGTYTVTLITTSSTRCTNNISRTVKVANIPQADFTVMGELCVNNTFTFVDKSSTGDTVIDRQWDFDKFGKSSAVQPEITFTSVDGTGIIIPVTLTITTESGCSATISKEIVLNSIPHADFTYATTSEITPLQIKFTNSSSSGATSYLWDLGDGTQCEEKDLTYTYKQPGIYTISLTTVNDKGCAHTVNKELTISTVPDIFNLKLEYVEATINNGFITITAYVHNNSTVTINTIDFVSILEDQNNISNTWSGTLAPGNNTKYIYQVPAINGNVFPSSICVYALDQVNQIQSNKQCLGAENQFIALHPFPKPASKQINLPMIAPEQTIIGITIIDALGKNIYTMEEYSLIAGYNEIMLDTEKIRLQAGVYIIQYNFLGNILFKKIVIQ